MIKRSLLRTLPKTVWALGAVSLLTDTASDMIYPLLPELLRQLGGGAVALGVMEGAAELLASFVKVWSGHASDRRGRRGPYVVFGYGLAALARPLMALVQAPWQVVVARAADRVGKGIRSAPRDALIGAAVPPERRGLAFGLHRAMDNFGAVLGPIAAWSLLSFGGLSLRGVFAVALVPGLVATLLAWRAVRGELPATTRPEPRSGPASVESGARTPLSPAARRLLLVTGLFALGASADSFLMARLDDLRLPLAWIPIAWVTLQLAKALLNIPGGALADRLGARRVLIASWAIYALAYALFARAGSWWTFWAVFPLYAIHYGLGEGAEKSLMARSCRPHERGAAFGAQHAVHGVAMLPANVLFGVLYAKRPDLAFWASGALAALAAIALLVLIADDPNAPAAVTGEPVRLT